MAVTDSPGCEETSSLPKGTSYLILDLKSRLRASVMACELSCQGMGWIPRAEGCFFLTNYSGGLFVQPCMLPFQNFPPMFLVTFFGTVLGLVLLLWQCTRAPKEEDDEYELPSPDGPVGYDLTRMTPKPAASVS